MSPKYNSFRLFDFNVKDVKVEEEDKIEEDTEPSEKKKYCDLMFSRDSVDVISWFENIEKHVQGLLYEKKNMIYLSSFIKKAKSGSFDISLYPTKKTVLLQTGYKLYFPSIKDFNNLISNSNKYFF